MDKKVWIGVLLVIVFVVVASPLIFGRKVGREHLVDNTCESLMVENDQMYLHRFDNNAELVYPLENGEINDVYEGIDWIVLPNCDAVVAFAMEGTFVIFPPEGFNLEDVFLAPYMGARTITVESGNISVP